MRILGVSEKWAKLKQPKWTTFRYPRGDKDWQAGELVQVVYKPRSPQREKLGIARIVSVRPRELDSYFASKDVPLVSEKETKEDGFDSLADMVRWMERRYGLDYVSRMNKLTLEWVEKAIGDD